MLRNLLINNYALIEHLDIDFSSGFSVITGETGAGKSIILGALGLLMGNRSDAKAIKTGQKKCSIEATFDISRLDISSFFADNDIDTDGNECIVRREVLASGKSRAFINDTPVQVAQLKVLSSALIDIHSQHQNLLLAHEDFLLDILDIIAANADLRSRYANTYRTWHETVATLTELRKKCEEDSNNRDFLQFQYTQLEEAHLQESEQEKLEEEADMLGHAEEIKAALYDSNSLLSDERGNIVGNLRQLTQTLQNISKVYPSATELADRTDSARIELEDIAAELAHTVEQIDFDPVRQNYVDERLQLIYDLEKRHHVSTIAELLAIQDKLRTSLGDIDNSDELIAAQEQLVRKSHDELLRTATEITATRQQAANTMAKALRDTLIFLGMPAVKLHFEICPRTAPTPSGMDSVTLLFSANKNQSEQDVSQVASGGEIARLMLALKTFISRKRNLPTIIFDEIDTGVSGTIAEKMAVVMQQMGENGQVICITHLPQIAALGTHHYRVYKTETTDGTSSHIVRLTTEERVQEIANMLSGAEMTEAAINNAKALLNL